jgi:hypothetical protein
MRWHADHIVSRAEAHTLGWSEAQTDNPSNIGVSHKSCDARAGAQLKAKMYAQKKAEPRSIPKVERPKLIFSEKSLEPLALPRRISPSGGAQ